MSWRTHSQWTRGDGRPGDITGAKRLSRGILGPVRRAVTLGFLFPGHEHCVPVGGSPLGPLWVDHICTILLLYSESLPVPNRRSHQIRVDTCSA